ncbi:hypothetical protein BLNAU_19299 [Blattamonas nauphoetae]|uniref:Uncharacterized protein n=1 Tax=Blattamonas nauphoetae TaxID=2049346 RepID=A0ABQ9X213_9EUKA|nr:hypothetical protein BLNAU_19299 [Blattamonas nauphoetae]
MEESARNYNLCGRKGGTTPLKRRNGKITSFLREGELKRKKHEVGNEEREVEEMGGMVKEIRCRERGMGEKSEIRKRQSLEFRRSFECKLKRRREREEERKKARQDEDEEEGDGEHHSSQTTRDDANQRRAGPISLSQTTQTKPTITVLDPVVVDSTREEKQQTQQQKEFMVEDGGEQTLNEDTVDPDILCVS